LYILQEIEKFLNKLADFLKEEEVWNQSIFRGYIDQYFDRKTDSNVTQLK